MALKGCKNVKIPVLDSLSEEEFNATYFKDGKPVIIRKSIEKWPARNWDLDSLQVKLGSTPIHVRTNTNCMQYRTGQQYNIRQTTFNDYISDIRNSNKRARSSYMAVQNIKKALPQLEEDIQIPEYVGKVHGGPFLWIANKDHYEYNHYDPDDGLLIVVNGEKKVRLFGCCDLDNLYPNDLGTKGRTVQSRVNFGEEEDEDIDAYVDFPMFKQATCHHGYLTNGDMLYIPAFWFHQVTTIQTTISINIFWGNSGLNDFTTKAMKQPTWLCFRYWLLNIIEQNRTHPSFVRILPRLHQSLPNFIMTQWHETLLPHQVDTLVRVIMMYLDITRNGGSGFDGVGGDSGGVVVEKEELFRQLQCAELNTGVSKVDDDTVNKGVNAGNRGVNTGNAPVLKIRGLLWRS